MKLYEKYSDLVRYRFELTIELGVAKDNLSAFSSNSKYSHSPMFSEIVENYEKYVKALKTLIEMMDKEGEKIDNFFKYLDSVVDDINIGRRYVKNGIV